jgi:hypothetical protein
MDEREPDPRPGADPEPDPPEQPLSALEDPRNVDLRPVDGPKPRWGYTREDAYRVLAGLPPRGTVNMPLAKINPPPTEQLPPNVRVTYDTRSPEEVDRLFAGLHGPKRERPEPEGDPTDPDDEA